MLNKKLKFAIYGGLIVAAGFSCKKNDPKPEPPTLNANDASSTLVAADASYKSDLVDYKNVTTTTTQSLNSLSILNGFEGGINVSGDISNISRIQSNDETNELLSQISFQLGMIGFKNSTTDPNARRIPVKFSEAKGIWVYTVTGFYNQGEWERIGESDFIVLKFPAKYNYVNDSTTINNATYTIKKLETYDGSYKYCNNGTEITSTFTGTAAIEAELEVDGVKKMTYSYTSTYDPNSRARSSASVNMTIDKYRYSFAYTMNATVYSSSYKWSKAGSDFFENSSSYEYNEPTATPTVVCTKPTIDNTPYKRIYSLGSEQGFKLYSIKYIRGNVTLEYSSDQAIVAAYISEAKTKYSITDVKNMDSTTYYKVQNDTTLQDKHQNYTLLRTSDRAKLGKVVTRLEKFTPQNSAFSYDRFVYYIVYSDGKRERLRNRFTSFDGNDNF